MRISTAHFYFNNVNRRLVLAPSLTYFCRLFPQIRRFKTLNSSGLYINVENIEIIGNESGDRKVSSPTVRRPSF